MSPPTKTPKLPLIAQARAVLQKYWQHDDFRPAQAEAVQHVLDGRDVLAVLPTGYGKSVLFQVPAMLAPGTALVLSPLIALMKDQCDDAVARGIPASFLTSHLTDEETEDRLAALHAGQYRVFYIAPERIRSTTFQRALRGVHVSYLAVDEVHCAARWGYDFRPAYMQIGALLAAITKRQARPPVLAVTATATPDIEGEIARAVGLAPRYQRVIADPVRSNLRYEVWGGNEWDALERAIHRAVDLHGRHIFYSATRNGAEKIQAKVAALTGYRGACGVYHAGLTPEQRITAQDRFKQGDVSIMAATCAFGMGIDVPDIRSVVHFGIPLSVEDYVQEAGRAGRDGRVSWVTCIESPFVERLRHAMIDAANPAYEYFEALWQWLHQVATPGETLCQTAKQMSDAMAADGVRLDPQVVSSVLDGMDAHGLIQRGYAPRGSGVVVRFQVAALKHLAEQGRTGLSKPAQRTLFLVWDRFVLPDLPANYGADATRHATVDLGVLTGLQPGASEASVRRHLADAAPDLTVDRAFAGKTTMVVPHTATLRELLPPGEITAKRTRAMERLRQMVAYTRTSAREDFIRAYFLRGVGSS